MANKGTMLMRLGWSHMSFLESGGQAAYKKGVSCIGACVGEVWTPECILSSELTGKGECTLSGNIMPMQQHYSDTSMKNKEVAQGNNLCWSRW